MEKQIFIPSNVSQRALEALPRMLRSIELRFAPIKMYLHHFHKIGNKVNALHNCKIKSLRSTQRSWLMHLPGRRRCWEGDMSEIIHIIFILLEKSIFVAKL